MLTTRIRLLAWQYTAAMYSSNAPQSISMSVWAGVGAVGSGEGGAVVDEGGPDDDGRDSESERVSE